MSILENVSSTLGKNLFWCCREECSVYIFRSSWFILLLKKLYIFTIYQHNLTLLVLARWGVVWGRVAAGSRGAEAPAPGPQGQQHRGQDQGGSDSPKHHHGHQAGLAQPGLLPPHHLLHGDAQQAGAHAVRDGPRGRYQHSQGGPWGAVRCGGRTRDR